MMVKVAPVPVIVMELLLGSVPTRLLKLIGEDECVVPDEIWNVTVARTPSAMTVLLRPTTTQRTSPGATILHVACLPAASAAAPVVKKVVPAGARSPDEYTRSHCTPDGCVPPLELNVMLIVTFAPGDPEPEESEIDGTAHAWVPSATVRPIRSTLVQNPRHVTCFGFITYVASLVSFGATSFFITCSL